MAGDGQEEVKLIGAWGSPYSRRVEMALKLKGVAYQYVEEDLSNKSDDLLKYNPIHKKVPVLIHNGKPISESLVIVEYIDETWKTGHPLLPKHPYDRAMARFWSRFIDDKCVLSFRTAARSQGEEKERLIEEVSGYLKVLEEQLMGRKFFGGDKVGFLDISATFIAHWMIILQDIFGAELLTEEKFPALWKWAEDFRSCPAVKESLPEKDRLFAYFKGRFQTVSAAAAAASN